MKIHKPTLVTRPILSFPGSLFHSLGVWIDIQLQKVAKTFPTYLNSSFDLLEDLKTLHVPDSCFLFTFDASSMYTNIPTDKAIALIEDYLTKNQHQFPHITVTPLIEALIILMKHNVFQFGDTFWLQLEGTAMGAPLAPTYANISFALYEILFIPKYNNNLY